MSNCEKMNKAEIEKEVADILRVSMEKIDEINARKESSNFHLNFKEEKDDESKMAVNEFIGSAASEDNLVINPTDIELKKSRPVKKSVSFMLGTYQPTFQMQPEIINSAMQNFEQNFVFGSSTKNKVDQKTEDVKTAAKESLELLRKSMDSLEKRDYTDFTNNFLELASKLSVEKREQIKEFKNRISGINVQKKMQMVEIGSIEKSLKDVESHLEEILSSKQGQSLEKNEQQYLSVIQKFCDILSALFDQITDDPIEELIEIQNACAEESLDDNPVKHDLMSEKNKCQCFSKNKESDNRHSNEPSTYASEVKRAQSVNFGGISNEEMMEHAKSFSSLSSTQIIEHKLRKIINEEDLTKVNSTELLKSQPSIGESSEMSGNNIICVAAISKIISDHHIDINELKKSLGKSSELSVESEPYSNAAIINDLNDDGYLDLPKVPSNSLSDYSSSAFIDENKSFFGEGDNLADENRGIPRSIQNDPAIFQDIVLKSTFGESQPSASVNMESEKKPKRFCKCRKFLRRLSNSLRRSKGKN